MDRLKAIECLVSAVECGTLSKAAEKLQISVAAVSRAVSELESHRRPDLGEPSSETSESSPDIGQQP